MDTRTKEQIVSLRENGRSYAQIAETLNLSINTVKSYWRRNILSSDQAQSATRCLQCGSILKNAPGRKQRRFCSDNCRMSWWNNHPELVMRNLSRTFTCQACGTQFQGHGHRDRKYCSLTCYRKTRAVRV